MSASTVRSFCSGTTRANTRTSRIQRVEAVGEAARPRAGREVVRVGHHAFDPEAPTSVTLTALHASLDEAVAALW